jgi:hypothetical protein
MNKDEPDRHPRSHLFTVHAWQEEVSRDQTEWRGKVQLITDGTVRYFRGWEAQAPLLLAMLLDWEALPDPHG